MKGERFKSVAFTRAADSLKALPYPVTSPDQVAALPGIGASVSGIISEYLATGKVARLQKDQQDEALATARDLARVHGIGPVKGAALARSAHIRDLNDLAARADISGHEMSESEAEESEAEEQEEQEGGGGGGGGGAASSSSTAAAPSKAAKATGKTAGASGVHGTTQPSIELTHAQRIGLKYVREFETPADRDEVERLVGHVRKATQDVVSGGFIAPAAP
jgi:hypothetical protein